MDGFWQAPRLQFISVNKWQDCHFKVKADLSLAVSNTVNAITTEKLPLIGLNK